MTIQPALSSLKDEQLLSAFLPVTVVKELVAEYQTIPRILLNTCPRELAQIKGIGPIKAKQMQYLAEVSRRIYREANMPATYIRSPQDMVEYCRDLQHQTQEFFKVIHLSTKSSVICEHIVAKGTLNAALVGPREVFSKAVKIAAHSVILIHNHPSGDPAPSQEDVEVTKRMVEAGKILDIAVLDHIIMGNGRYVSLKEKGVI